jgi:hypothetical protein
LGVFEKMAGELSLWRVTNRRFCCGFVVKDGVVVDCAPALKKWIKGRSFEEAKSILRGMEIEFIPEDRKGKSHGR